MKQHQREDFVLIEDVLVRMLRILRSIAQDLETLQNRKSLHIKQAYRFDEVVRDNACYENNNENGNFALLDNSIPSKETINWPFTSTTNSPHTYVDLDQPPKFDDYIDLVE